MAGFITLGIGADGKVPTFVLTGLTPLGVVPSAGETGDGYTAGVQGAGLTYTAGVQDSPATYLAGVQAGASTYKYDDDEKMVT